MLLTAKRLLLWGRAHTQREAVNAVHITGSLNYDRPALQEIPGPGNLSVGLVKHGMPLRHAVRTGILKSCQTGIGLLYAAGIWVTATMKQIGDWQTVLEQAELICAGAANKNNPVPPHRGSR
jgi:hypothetical protein